MNWPRLYFYMNINVAKIVYTLAMIARWLLKIGRELAKIALHCLFLCIYPDSKIGSKTLQIAKHFVKIADSFAKIEPLVTF